VVSTWLVRPRRPAWFARLRLPSKHFNPRSRFRKFASPVIWGHEEKSSVRLRSHCCEKIHKKIKTLVVALFYVYLSLMPDLAKQPPPQQLTLQLGRPLAPCCEYPCITWIQISFVTCMMKYLWGLIAVAVASHLTLVNASAFPREFMWGTATSSYQIEGAWNVSGALRWLPPQHGGTLV
jgi:hypothetical protein